MRAWLAGAMVLLSGLAQAADAPTLNVYNWNDYIGPDVVAQFEKATGAHVNYDLYDANETVEAKLAAGKSGYDIVVPTLVPFAARGIAAGQFLALDRAKLPHWGNLDPAVLKRMEAADPGNAHAVPWIIGTVGLGIDVAKVSALLPGVPLDSWDVLFKPENAAKLKACGISILDSPSDVFPVVLRWLGRDPNSEDEADLKAATAALQAIRPSIRKFDGSGYINALAGGEVCVALGYSTDIGIAGRRAKEAGTGREVRYVLPKPGTLLYIDALAVPKDAPHPELALAFIDFVLDGQVAAETANAVHGRTGVAAAEPFLDAALKGDPTLYPPAELEQTLFVSKVTGRAYERLRTRAWTALRSGR